MKATYMIPGALNSLVKESKMAKQLRRLQLLLVAFFPLLAADVGSDGVCRQTPTGLVCEENDTYRLKRVESGKVGFEKELILEDRTITRKTLSLKPLLFEIPHFLSDDECEYFKSLATKEGLKDSVTVSNNPDNNRFRVLDKNNDKQLSISEMRQTIEDGYDIYPDNEDILQLYAEKDLDTNNDGFITRDELGKITPASLAEYWKDFVTKHPEKHSRFSKQVWLYPDTSSDEVLQRLQLRVSALTELPLELVKMSDFQVVQYDVKGHYNAHYDSSRLDERNPCCRRFDTRPCRICRYMTILFYLNDVEDGGETAFLVADNSTVDHEFMRDNNYLNLYRRCEDAMLSVKPGKGKAVMWYNHHIRDGNQWLGEMDMHSIHGGCPVRSGEKWIANFWIKVTDDKDEDIEKLLKLKY